MPRQAHAKPPARAAQPALGQWSGKWCWTMKHLTRPWNYYAYFRRSIDLPSAAVSARVRVTADARYTLYVNGRRVHHGPARSYPEHYAFDSLDLAPFLVAGRNTICVICHQFGVSTFQSVYREASGFLLDGAIETAGDAAKSIPLHTPDDWLCREAVSWRKDVARLSVQMGFQEHFDADTDPADWMSVDYDPSPEQGWIAPFVCGPAGYHPWLNLVERGVPLLVDRVHDFSAVGAEFRGTNARGYKIAPDVYHFPHQEKRERIKSPSLLRDRENLLRVDDTVATIGPLPDGEFAMVVLDPGVYRTGHVMLDIADAAGDEIIDILYTETLDRAGGPELLHADGKIAGSKESTADRYRCRPGAQRWEPFFFKGFRYVTLVFRNVEGERPLKLRRVSVRQVQAGVEDVGSFECSDDLLNRIWHVGRETQRNCLFDAFVDCPWRELAMWWGDARVQSRVTAHAFGDSSILERGIRLVAESQAADGSLHAHPPSDMPQHRLPDFMLTWVGTLWDHYFHTGRTDLLVESLPTLHRLMDFFQRHEVLPGLIGGFSGGGWWLFLDWVALFKQDVSATLNLWYVQALQWAADICRLAGDAEGHRRYRRKAGESTAAVIERFWNDEAGAWRDGFDLSKSEPVDQFSQHANTLGILLNLKPESNERIARQILLKSAQGRRGGGKILTASPFFYAYVLEALARTGHAQEAVEIIRDKWGALVEGGATTFPEMWDVTFESHCHAWSSSPVYHLMQQVLGVMPVEPGWQRVRIAPVPGELDFARGVVPSPLGPISVDWERADDQLAVRVEIPEGMTAEFHSPSGAGARTVGAGSHEFQG